MNNWWQNREKGGIFWLRLSFLLVRLLPDFIVKFFAIFISFFYFIFIPSARSSIYKFYENLLEFQKKPRIPTFKKLFYCYLNFYEFAVCLADKIAVWCGKFSPTRLKVEDEQWILNTLKDQEKGKILLSYHYGNAEIARSFEHKLGKSKIYILMYGKSSQNFINFMNKISKEKINIIFVEELGIEQVLELEKIINSGSHIAMMSDRVGINASKNESISFLGKECLFPTGAFDLARILNTQVLSTLCLRKKDTYSLVIKELKSDEKDKKSLAKDQQKKYIKILEEYVIKEPKLWFNFYDFWGQGNA